MSDRANAVEVRLPASLAEGVRAKLERAAAENVADRLRAADATLWGEAGTPEVANRLGWLDIHERMLAEIHEVEQFAQQVGAEGIEHVVLLGMGGSSLAPEVLRLAFGRVAAHPELHVLDSTDAATIAAVEKAIEPERSLFVVSSKSGGTIEPLSLLAHFWSLVPDGARFVCISVTGTGLEALARERGFRRTFAGDPDIGGRYSALSPFGIVPAALMGADVRALLSGAGAAWTTALTAAGIAEPPDAELPAGVWLGAALSALAQAGRDKLTFVISGSLPGLGLWLEQLVAESTGKHGKGVLPVADEPLGAPGSYGEDRVFAYLPDLDRPDAALEERVAALAAAGHPVITLPTHGPRDLGRVFLLAELAVAVVGWGLDINPFDQPNVQQAKDATKKVLDGYEAQHGLPEPQSADAKALAELLLGAAPPDYVAIMAYSQPSAEFDEAVSQLRELIRDRTRATTTFGYGPRFLHSTGQFHKGGPRTGRFLQLVHDGPEDVEIPGAPYTFTTLKNAQAIGDLDTLRTVGLPALRVRLAGEDPVSALRALTATIKEQT